MKKKLLFFAMCLFAFTGNVMAQTVAGKGDLYYNVDKTDIMPGKTARVTFYYDQADDQDFRGFQVEFILPEGMKVLADSWKMGPEVAANNPEMDLKFSERYDNGEDAQPTSVFMGVQIATTTMPFGEGIECFSFKVMCDEDVAEGEYPVETVHCELADMKTGQSYHVDPKTMIYNVIPYGPRILLDTDPEVPEPSDVAETVIVKRTVKADVWSTLTLPFELTGDQFKEIFGANAKVAEFINFEKNDADQYVVNFEEYDAEDGIAANYPVLIKSENALDEIVINEKIMVEPDDEAAFAEYTNGKTGARKQVYATMYGTLKGNTEVPENYFLIRDNKFYVSTGNSTINAFRAYFEIVGYAYGAGGSNISFMVNDEATSIDGINGNEIVTGDVYSVNGTYMGKAENVMSKLPRGIYIVNNKKVVVK
jgi:hypothetical protein